MTRTERKTMGACEKLHAKDKAFKRASNIDLILFVIGLIIGLLAVRAFITEPVKVQGESMQNTLQHGERCMVEKISYWFTRPKAGDIVIVHYPERGNESFVKRVIATEGQTIELVTELETDPVTGNYEQKYVILVDGEKLDESKYEANMLFDNFFASPWRINGIVGSQYTVPEGCVFVMGDHRTNSHDSRAADVGAIPFHDVVGRVHVVVYPFSNLRFVK